MNSNELVFKKLYELEFKFVKAIEIEYTSGYYKALRKLQSILSQQNVICTYHFSFLLFSLDNLYRHNFILIVDLKLFKSLLLELKPLN